MKITSKSILEWVQGWFIKRIYRYLIFGAFAIVCLVAHHLNLRMPDVEGYTSVDEAFAKVQPEKGDGPIKAYKKWCLRQIGRPSENRVSLEERRRMEREVILYQGIFGSDRLMY